MQMYCLFVSFSIYGQIIRFEGREYKFTILFRYLQMLSFQLRNKVISKVGFQERKGGFRKI